MVRAVRGSGNVSAEWLTLDNAASRDQLSRTAGWRPPPYQCPLPQQRRKQRRVSGRGEGERWPQDGRGITYKGECQTFMEMWTPSTSLVSHWLVFWLPETIFMAKSKQATVYFAHMPVRSCLTMLRLRTNGELWHQEQWGMVVTLQVRGTNARNSNFRIKEKGQPCSSNSINWLEKVPNLTKLKITFFVIYTTVLLKCCNWHKDSQNRLKFIVLLFWH